jgi:hypothetical protein
MLPQLQMLPLLLQVPCLPPHSCLLFAPGWFDLGQLQLQAAAACAWGLLLVCSAAAAA